jgi:flavin-dependent dehydrogenase
MNITEEAMAHIGKQAVVGGAGMSGLLAARALADHFDEVTILERDALPGVNRRHSLTPPAPIVSTI